jgi:hypothetical protein
MLFKLQCWISMMQWRIRNLPDAMAHKLARMLPNRVVMWCYVRVIAHASYVHGNLRPDEITYSIGYKAWVKQ